jgi:hypothetical protein
MARRSIRTAPRNCKTRGASQKSSQAQRIDARSIAARVRVVACVVQTSCAHPRDAHARASKTPCITISGAWLRAAGFAVDKPCLVRAFAKRQLIVYQPD